MSIPILILGQSGTGKTASLRNLDPKQCLIIQAIQKPLPFKSSGWSIRSQENPDGNVVVSDDPEHIGRIIQRTQRPIVIIDDWNFIMTNEFMRRAYETGFTKFSEIGGKAWQLLMITANATPPLKRVYFLGHTQEDDNGQITAKCIGKLLTEKICIEAMFTIVMRAQVINGTYIFSTLNNGRDTTKTPIGMFADEHIPNDLSVIDKQITAYYGG